MARDFKEPPARARSAPRPARRASKGGARWPWFLAGLCVGVVGTVAVLRYDPGPALERAVSGKQAAAGASEKRPPRFEFYTLLPEKEIAIPETSLDAPKQPSGDKGHPAETAAPVDDGARYLLQVASFRKLEDADRLKARLAFLGLDSSIQTVSIDGAETWHRVRVGPYTGRAELDEARARLKENHYEALLLKLK